MSKDATVRPTRAKRRPYVSADERRRQIIQAAQEAFSRSSLQGVSTREIAKAANVNPATLFEHFGSKEALFREAVITPLIASMGELRGRVRSYHQTQSRAISDDIAKAGVCQQMEVMKKLFPLFTSALFSDLEAGRALYNEHIVPHLLEREAMVRGLASDETDPYFLELAALGMLFAIAMDETFSGGRLSRPEYASQFIQLFTVGTARKAHDDKHQPDAAKTPLRRLRRLGPSELFVSPLALGTARFGTPGGPPADEAQRMLDFYREAGGNFIETANPQDAAAQDVVAELIRGRRQELVLSSNHRLLPADPADGMGSAYRNRVIRSVEQSLQRLRTDYIDLLYFDGLEKRMQVDEVLSACDHLIKEGKIRYAGMSGVPAWQASRMQAIAEVRGRSPMVALRVSYGLNAGSAAREMLMMAEETGLGVTSRVLYERTYPDGDKAPGAAVTRRRAEIVAAVEAVAEEAQCRPAQVALAWQYRHPALTSVVLHPPSCAKLEESIAALDVVLSDDQVERLDAASRLTLENPDDDAPGLA